MEIKQLFPILNIIDLSFDKWETFNFIKKLKFNVHKIYIDLDKAINNIENRDLKPLLVFKPR